MRPSNARKLRGLKNISWLTARQLDKLYNAMTITIVEKRGIIFDDKHTPNAAYILLSGVARISCRNRKGQRTLVIMVAPGMVPGFPPPVPGISYNFRCEAVTVCRIGAVDLEAFIEISLGVASADFRRLAASYLGRWDLVQLRCANFMSCTLEERLALILLELCENFGVPDPKGVRLTLPARHRDLAELVGASRPRITEHLILFEKKHLISRNRRQLVVNKERVETFLSQAHIAGDAVAIGTLAS
ncbi:MAG: Crp/Fnr family transcriptional regulator [Candidatus Binatus sp.]|uniref:Crp/Fnr family transcriptional regulator n=1 Tax=Candidatus Binatus sp. TaxID=2811406 RepID=UPI003BAE1E7E